MAIRSYTIILHTEPEEAGFTVLVPALSGIVTQGRDREDAIAMAKDATRCHIRSEPSLCP